VVRFMRAAPCCGPWRFDTSMVAARGALSICVRPRRPWTLSYSVSPTVFRARGYRFYFFPREEPRMHVHAQHAKGEAKFWLEPKIEIAQNYGLRTDELSTAEDID